MKTYHAHFYFSLSEITKAKELCSKAQKVNGMRFAGFIERPIGPHPTPTFEFHIKESDLNEVRQWLKANHGSFSVLIHEDTGDDVKDHTENIEWFGSPVKLDFNFFELVKNRPDLKINK